MLRRINRVTAPSSWAGELEKRLASLPALLLAAHNMNNTPLLRAAGAIALWSTLATLGTLTRTLPPFFVVGISLIVGSLLSVHRYREWRVTLPTLALGIYGLFGYHLLLFAAFRLAPALEVNLLNYLWPLLIVLLSPVILPGFHLTSRNVLAAFLGFLGAGLIVSGGHFSVSTAALPGYALAICAALVWSSFSLLLRRVPHFPNSATGGFCLASGLLALACHFVLEPRVSPSMTEWLYLAGLGLGPMGWAFFLWDHALKHGDPRQIGALSYSTPLLSTLLLVLSGQGKLTPVSGIAIMLILGGAIWGTLPPRK